MGKIKRFRPSPQRITPLAGVMPKPTTFRVQSSPTFGGVLLEMNQPVQMIGFKPEEAITLGEQLIAHGKHAKGGPAPVDGPEKAVSKTAAKR